MTLDVARTIPGRIVSTGVAFPERFSDGEPAQLDNAAVIRLLSPEGRRGPRSEEEIAEMAEALSESWGVGLRRWAHRVGDPFDDDEVTSRDLQRTALERALEDSSIDPSLLGGLIAASSTPARATGANATHIAGALGLRCAAWDIRTGCSGGLVALVQGFVLAELCQQPIAVLAGDTFSKLVPPSEPLAGLVFGDGAGAAVVGPASDGAGLLSASLASDGALGHLGSAPAPFPPTVRHLEEGKYFLSGSPDQLAQKSPDLYADAIVRALRSAGLEPGDLDLFIPHQGGKEVIESVRTRCGLGDVPTSTSGALHGNTGAGSVLIALHEEIAANRLAPGQTVLFAALGGGLAWGAAVIRM